MKAREVALKLHRWGGLVTGLVVSVLCLTGAVLLITEPADQARLEQIGREAPPDGAMLPPSRLVEIASTAAGEGLPRSIVISIANPRRADVAMRNDVLVSVDPWDGSVLRAFHHETSLSGRLEVLHTNLMLGSVGELTVKWFNIVFVLLLVLGLWLWWPTRRTMRRSFLIELRRGFKRANYDLHNVLGFYSALLLLVLGGTGVLLSYPGLQSFAGRAAGAVAARVGGSGGEQAALPPNVRVESAPPDTLPIMDHVWNTVRVVYPTAPWQRMSFTGAPPFGYRVQVGAGEASEVFHFNTVYANRAGEIRRVVPASAEPIAGRLSRLVGRLHTGSINGPYRVASFIACVIGALLPLTGLIVWYPRWRRRRAGKGRAADDPGILSEERPVSD